MTIKEYLIKNHTYTPIYDFTNSLGCNESILLSYFISLVEHYDNDNIELTASVVDELFPNWGMGSIKKAFNSLEAENLVIKGDNKGRGFLYTLNIDNVINLIRNWKENNNLGI